MRFSLLQWHRRQCDWSNHLRLRRGGSMIRIKEILVPIDFSDVSTKAVNYGLSLALEFDSKLILAHIVPFDSSAYEKAKNDLLALIPEDYRERLNFEIIVKAGDVHAELMAIV